jgi:hypothetical protein
VNPSVHLGQDWCRLLHNTANVSGSRCHGRASAVGSVKGPSPGGLAMTRTRRKRPSNWLPACCRVRPLRGHRRRSMVLAHRDRTLSSTVYDPEGVESGPITSRGRVDPGTGPILAPRILGARSIQLLLSSRPEGAKSAHRHLAFYKAHKGPGLGARLPARRKDRPRLNRRQ